MKKEIIKNLLRESGNNPHIKHVEIANKAEDEEHEEKYDKISNLLGNDIFNHAAIVRKLSGEKWKGNSEATNRSLFRKKLNKEPNEDGSVYEFDDETLSDIQKILMGLSSTINHKIGRQGK